MADTHFRIEKEVELEKTTTKLVKLSMEETIEEISRLLGGDLITENVRNNAIELKDLARKTKSL